MWSSTNVAVKHHYVYSGEPLAYLRQHGTDERELVKWCLENSNITRIDIALTSQREDGKKHGFAPHQLAWAVRDGMLKSRMKPSKDVSEDMKTQTKYIGNRTSRARLFRAYDKGADNEALKDTLIRYELETRRGTKVIGRAVVSGENYGAIIRRYVDFPSVAAWREIMEAEPARMAHEKQVLSAHEMAIEKSLSRWYWLQKSIPKTVKKALSEDFERFGTSPHDNKEFHTFLREIMAQLDEA